MWKKAWGQKVRGDVNSVRMVCVNSGILIKGNILREWERRGEEDSDLQAKCEIEGDIGGGEHKHHEIWKSTTGQKHHRALRASISSAKRYQCITNLEERETQGKDDTEKAGRRGGTREKYIWKKLPPFTPERLAFHVCSLCDDEHSDACQDTVQPFTPQAI